MKTYSFIKLDFFNNVFVFQNIVKKMSKQVVGAVVFSFFSITSFADVTIKFNAMPISQVADSFFRSMLKADFVMSSSLVADNRAVTINVNNIPQNQLFQTFQSLLLTQGVSVTKKQNIYFLDIVKSDNPLNQNQLISQAAQAEILQTEIDFYKPKNRTASELAELLQLFNVQASTKNNEFLVFSVPEKNKQNLLKILEKIDLPQNQYEVIAATYEVSTIDDSQRSIDIIGNIFKNLSLSIVTSGASNLIKYTGGSLVNAFKFFDTDTRFRSISKPYGIVKSGGKLQFNSGQDVPTLGAITTNNNVTTQSVEYKQSGVLLDVDLNAVQDVIDVKINHELSNFIQTKTGVNNSPTLNKRTLKTNLTIKDGEIVIIGGISDLSTTKSNSSALGLVPIERTKGNKQTETYIFLQVTKI